MSEESLKVWLKSSLGADGYAFLVWLYHATIGQVLAEPRLRVLLVEDDVELPAVMPATAKREGIYDTAAGTSSPKRRKWVYSP